MKILIAEDDKVAAAMLERALSQWNYEVVSAPDGAKAWTLLQKEPFQLVISDWMMPEMDGAELCARLRSYSSDCYTYFIMLTAKDKKEDRILALEQGADDVLTKPLDKAELFARLSVARRILGMEQQLRDQNSRLQDLSEEMQLQTEELQNSHRLLGLANRRFTELFENMPIACYTFDEDGLIHEWNQASQQLFGFQHVQVLLQAMDNFPFAGSNEREIGEMIQSVLSGQPFVPRECEVQSADGRSLYVMRSVLPLKDVEGRIVGGIVANVDVSERVLYERELRTLNSRLENLAETDGLTGLKNHRAFQEFYERSFKQACLNRRPLSIFLMDVDQFKQFNDTHGHPEGDKVLQEVANILKDSMRPSDFLARYGGEEFVGVLPNTSLETASLIAERLRSAIEQGNWRLRAITGSFGVASLRQDHANRETLLKEADESLYKAKQAGRNRVWIAGTGEAKAA